MVSPIPHSRVLQRWGSKRSPQGNARASSPRAAFSHSHSVGGEFASPAAMIEHVRAHPGAIGYVPYRELGGPGPAGLRVLRVSSGGAELRPSDPAYPIRQR